MFMITSCSIHRSLQSPTSICLWFVCAHTARIPEQTLPSHNVLGSKPHSICTLTQLYLHGLSLKICTNTIWKRVSCLGVFWFQWWITGRRGDRNRYLHDSITWCNLLTRIYIHHRYRIWELPTTTTAWSFLLSEVWRSLSQMPYTVQKKVWGDTQKSIRCCRILWENAHFRWYFETSSAPCKFLSFRYRQEEYQGYANLLMISHSQWAHWFNF